MGPCSIEDEEQVITTVNFLKENNIKFMRGGIFKPRSSPYAFRGLGIDGLKFFSKHCKDNGIKVVSEVMQVSQIEEMYEYTDVYQVGTRNAQNFNLLDELGKIDKPVLLKRGMSSTIQEFLASAEYIFSMEMKKLYSANVGANLRKSLPQYHGHQCNSIPARQKSPAGLWGSFTCCGNP
jgi:3-deoxy-7-phosphoheptulonate synthase